MKILLIGLLSFLGWTALSGYVYVCKIKGFCNESANIQMIDKNPEGLASPDTLNITSAMEIAVKPEKLVLYFDFDKSEINSFTEANNYLKYSEEYLNQNSNAKLSITGHTDEVGTIGYNQLLGNRRALSVQKYFEGKGIESGRFILQSRGEEEPAESNSTIKGRAKNRRTEITINN